MAKEVNVPAGFWIRVIPSIIDSLLVGITLHLATGFRYMKSEDLSTTFALSAVNGILAGIYAGFFYMKTGSTLGKKVFSLAVVDNQTGEKISFLRGFFRESVGKIVSVLPFGLGFVVAAFNKDKRTLHDYIFDTRVVKRAEVVEFHATQPAAVVDAPAAPAAPVSPPNQEEF